MTTYSGNKIKLSPDAAVFETSVTREGDGTQGVSTTEVVNSPETFVDRLGVLHASDKLKTGDTIKVKAKCTYINPSGSTTPMEDEITITVA